MIVVHCLNKISLSTDLKIWDSDRYSEHSQDMN